MFAHQLKDCSTSMCSGHLLTNSAPSATCGARHSPKGRTVSRSILPTHGKMPRTKLWSQCQRKQASHHTGSGGRSSKPHCDSPSPSRLVNLLPKTQPKNSALHAEKPSNPQPGQEQVAGLKVHCCGSCWVLSCTSCFRLATDFSGILQQCNAFEAASSWSRCRKQVSMGSDVPLQCHKPCRNPAVLSAGPCGSPVLLGNAEASLRLRFQQALKEKLLVLTRENLFEGVLLRKFVRCLCSVGKMEVLKVLIHLTER